MNFPKKPRYTNGEIDRAGETARSSKPSSRAYEDAVSIINAWRVSHEYPMQTFNVTLRNKARAINTNAIVARRLKRLVTILDKIGNRQGKMRLSRMQDIGGVRAIMKDIGEVDTLRDIYLERGRFPHILKGQHDYIRHPKESGYRGIHLVYQFNNSQGRQPDSRDWDGLNIEMQLRTELQHAWATSVEIVGTMRHENLKSSIGNKRWLEFFQCMSSIIAQLEDQPVLPQHTEWDTQQLYRRAHALVNELDAIETMRGWVNGMNWINEKGDSYYYILVPDIRNNAVVVSGFRRDDLHKANARLEELERQAALKQGSEPVLVVAGDSKSLKRAYPNYALDSHRFLEIVDMVVETVNNAV